MSRSLIVLLGLMMICVPVMGLEGEEQSPNEVMTESIKNKETGLTELQLQEKHRITFYMALPLLLLIILTTSLGVAMGVFGKRHLYLWHMVSAGLTVTLAVAHAVVGVVWFFPF